MGERRIWKIIVWTLIATGLVILLAQIDPGFLSRYLPGGVIPISTGSRVEILVAKAAVLRGRAQTDLYWLEDDGSFEKVRSFDQAPQCVTALDGKLFITFEDQKSSFIADGRWVRGVAGPHGFTIIDVAPFEGKIHAFGVTEDNRGIRVASLTEQGWQVAPEPFDTARKIIFRGCINVAGGLEALYVTGPVDFAGRLDVDELRWYHVFFDGRKWGGEKSLAVPPRTRLTLGSYEGELAIALIPLDEGQPVRLALVRNEALEIVAEVANPGKGQIQSAWLVQLAGGYRVILAGAGSVWEVPFDDLEAGEPRRLAQIDPSATFRSNVYVQLLAVAAVLLVSLGVTWLVMRVRALRRARNQ